MTGTADSAPPRWSAGKRRLAGRSPSPPRRAVPERRSDFPRVFPWGPCSAWNVRAKFSPARVRCYASWNSAAPPAQGIFWLTTGGAPLSVFWRIWVTDGLQKTGGYSPENAPRSAGSPPRRRQTGGMRRPFGAVMQLRSGGGVPGACRSASENILHVSVKSSCRYA